MATPIKTSDHLMLGILFIFVALAVATTETQAKSTKLNRFDVDTKYPNRTSRNQQSTRIPGLYNEQFIEPIVGQAHFDRAVLKRNPDDSLNNTEQSIALVQYYLATCPDCQGFSPYFKRFVADIGGHWHRLVKVYVVNCNDDTNQNFCWHENPNLTVPLIRWYTFPKLLTQYKDLGYPSDLLNVNQREYIEKQRRDLVSLRRATLRFITTTVETLARGSDKKYGQVYENSLPLYWRSFRQLGSQINSISRRKSNRNKRANENVKFFLDDLRERNEKCANQTSGQIDTIKNFIIFEPRNSFIGRNILADWSNYTCPSDAQVAGGKAQPMMVHYTTDWSVFGQPGFDLQLSSTGGTNESSPKPLLVLGSRSARGELSFRLLEGQKKEAGEPKIQHKRDVGQRHRETFDLPQKSATRAKRSTFDPEAENINWAPADQLYPGEEATRLKLNKLISRELFGLGRENESKNPIPGLRDEDLGEIKRNITINDGTPVDPTEEDLSFVTLSDYYKALSEIVHKNIISKREIDGYQLTSAACFIRKLVKFFPFQGEKDESGLVVKSMVKQYLRLLDDQLIELLREQTGRSDFSCSHRKLLGSEEERKKLSQIKISSDQFEQMKTKISRDHKIGLVSSKMLKYAYCKGSSEYLRGHTCSLWILFHTLTVEEFVGDISEDAKLRSLYLDDNSNSGEDDDDEQPHGKPIQELEPEVYKYTINYNETAGKCEPANPERAFLNSTSAQLYVDAPKFAIANVINFVRFYLTCTNCAAHFSCMVMNSKLDFQHKTTKRFASIGEANDINKRLIGDHMLWLWEAHNRVNIRTRRTHSEDPLHPKHVFPTIDACPKCYITSREKLEPISQLEHIKFNRNELIKFLVQRYRKQSILHNKIRIEELYFKENEQQTTTSPHPDRH